MSSNLQSVYVKCASGGLTKQFFQSRAYAEDIEEIALNYRTLYLLFAVIFRKETRESFRKIFLLCENAKLCPEKRNIACNTTFLYEVFYTAKSL